MIVVVRGRIEVRLIGGAHLSNICSSVTQPFDRIRHDDEDS